MPLLQSRRQYTKSSREGSQLLLVILTRYQKLLLWADGQATDGHGKWPTGVDVLPSKDKWTGPPHSSANIKTLACLPSLVNPGPKGSDNIDSLAVSPTPETSKYTFPSAEPCRHVSSFNLSSFHTCDIFNGNVYIWVKLGCQLPTCLSRRLFKIMLPYFCFNFIDRRGPENQPHSACSVECQWPCLV